MATPPCIAGCHGYCNHWHWHEVMASYAKQMRRLARTSVLILDDWGLAPLTAEQRRDLLEILEDRHGSRSTIVTSQVRIEKWHDIIGDPTLADAVLDRLVHGA